MNIGQAAHRAGLSARMIRYYEAEGLLPPARRLRGGHRYFTEADVQRLVFVRQARDLGFSVAEIAELVALSEEGAVAGEKVLAMVQARLESLRRDAELIEARRQALERALRREGTPGAIGCRLIGLLREGDVAA